MVAASVTLWRRLLKGAAVGLNKGEAKEERCGDSPREGGRRVGGCEVEPVLSNGKVKKT